MKAGYLAVVLTLGSAVYGQVSGNSSLTGKYYFRQVLLVTDGTANVTDTRSGAGTITFDGNGNFTVSGQQLIGAAAAAALDGSGTYTVKPGGLATLSNPLRSGATVNARLGVGAVVGSSTEAGPTVFDLFIAIPAPAQNLTNATVNGPYWISSLEFPNGGTANIRNTNFKLTAHGTGSFDENKVTGQAANLANSLQTQTTGAITYSVLADGTGSLNFPAGDATQQLIAGAKNVFFSADGTYFIGGSMASGLHGLVVGVKAFSSGASNANWNGFYFAAGLRFDVAAPSFPARLSAVAGSVHATGALGSAVWSRRTRQTDGLLEANPLITYTLSADGSGPFPSTPGRVTLASDGNTFATTGVDIVSSLSYEMYFGALMPPQSGPGVFLNPQGVFNAANFAPLGYPLSPGEFVALNGTGFGSGTFTASSLPFPLVTPTGVSATVNGIPAPIYSVTTVPVAQVVAVIPYGVTGSTATIVLTINGVKSNSVDIPLASTGPGIFTVPSAGFGDGAIRDLSAKVVNASNPAVRGQFVTIYLTGLGPVDHPPVPDGAAAPSVEPLARMTGPVNVYIAGQKVSLSDVPYAGLTPTLSGLYQINVKIPLTVPSGSVGLAIQTAEAFTDMANIVIQ